MSFPSLMELANYNGVLLRFSGTVGGIAKYRRIRKTMFKRRQDNFI